MTALLPFSSYGPASEAVRVCFDVEIDDSVNSNAFVKANGGFVYGETVVIDSINDPPIVGGGGTLSPSAWPGSDNFNSATMTAEIDDTYKNVVGFGHSNAFNWTLDLDVATDITLVDNTIEFSVPPAVGIGGLWITEPGTDMLVLICIPVEQTALPLGCVSYTQLCNGCITDLQVPPPCLNADRTNGEVCDGGQGYFGGGEIIMVATYSDPIEIVIEGVPMEFYEDGSIVDPPGTSAAVDNTATVTITGPSGAGGGGGGGGGGDLNVVVGSSTQRQQLTIGKSAIASGSGGSLLSLVPGAELTYTLQVDVSGDHAYSNLVIDDVIRDGQLYDASKGVSVVMFGQTLDLAPFTTVDVTSQKAPSNPAGNGDSIIVFNLGAAWDAANGGTPSPIAGRSTQTITYHTVIQQQYTNRLAADGSKTVYGGDCLDNSVILSGSQTSTADGSDLGPVTRNAAATVSAAQGTLQSVFYAVDGTLCSTNQALCDAQDFLPGTQFTIRLKLDMLHTSFRELSLNDAFPIPLFNIANLRFPVTGAGNVIDVTQAANRCSATSIPALDRMCVRAPSHTLSTGTDPVLSVNGPSNSFKLDFGSNEDPATGGTPSVIDVLYTVSLTDQPWIDGFTVVTLEDMQENPGAACNTLQTGRQVFRTRNPKLCYTQGFVSRKAGESGAVTTYETGFGFSAGSANAPLGNSAPFSSITQAQSQDGSRTLGTTLSGDAEAGDVLRVALLVANSGLGSARDLRFQLPISATDDYSNPTAVFVYNGAGDLVSSASYNVATGELTIPTLPGKASRDTADASGENVFVIMYDTEILPTFQQNRDAGDGHEGVLESELEAYAALAGGDNFVTTLHADGSYAASCVKNAGDVFGIDPIIRHTKTSSDPCTAAASRENVAIGEILRVETSVELAYGTWVDAKLRVDPVNNKEWTFLNATLLQAPGSSSTPAAYANGVALHTMPLTANTIPVQLYPLGDVTVPDTVADPPTIVWESFWRAEETGNSHNNAYNVVTTQFQYDAVGGTVRTISSGVPVRIQKNEITISGRTNETALNPADEGDIIEFCFDIDTLRTASCLHDGTVSIPVPMQFALVPGSISFLDDAGAAFGDTSTSTASTVSATFPLLDQDDEPVLCYNAEFVDAETGTVVTTTAQACGSTSPLAPDNDQGFTKCVDEPVSVQPLPGLGLVAATSDPCTNDAQNVARIGEVITLTSTATLPTGASNSFEMDINWLAANELLEVPGSGRVVSYGSCVSQTLAVGAAPTSSSAGLVRWSFGNINRAVDATPGCGNIVVAVDVRVTDVGSNSAGSTIDIGSVTRVQGFEKPESISFTVLEPQLNTVLTVQPDTGDAGDATQVCVTVQNPAPTNGAACAYDVGITVPLPVGFSSTAAPLAATFGQINPGATTAPVCFPVVVEDNVPTSACSTFTAAVVFDSGDNGRGDVSGAADEYCVGAPRISASILSTGDSCTTPALSTAAPGELVTYAIVVGAQEGTSTPLRACLTPGANLAFVSGSVANVGANLSPASLGSITPSNSGGNVCFNMPSVVNAGDNSDNAGDEITFNVVTRVVATAASGATLAPPVYVEHASAPAIVAATNYPVTVTHPALQVTASASPTSGGAQGDTANLGFVVEHTDASNGCAHDVTICDTVDDLDFDSGSVTISGVTPTPAVMETADGFCFTVPLLTPGTEVTVNYTATFEDLPPGEPRCTAPSAEFTSAPTGGFAPRTASGEACLPQTVLEALGNFVWIDTNGNGRQDGGETPIVGERVALIDPLSGAEVAFTLTDANGQYEFNRFKDGLVPSKLYTIEVPVQSGLHVTINDNLGGDDALDSDSLLVGPIASGVARISDASVAPVSEDFTYDFGFAEPIRIGDLVWRDLNGNGVQDEPASANLVGVQVELRDRASGSVLATSTTGSDGTYGFSSLTTPALTPGGQYDIVIKLDSQMPLETVVGGRDTFLVPTSTGGAGGAATDNNSVLRGDTEAVIAYDAPRRYNIDDQTLDFGLVDPPKLGFVIGDYVFLDANSDGVQDGGDVPLAGVTVQLLDNAGQLVFATTTGADGFYEFESLSLGIDSIQDYRLVLPAGQDELRGRVATFNDVSVANDASDSDGVQQADESIALDIFTPIDGQRNMTYDFGVRQIEIGGDVWLDTDGDGESDETTPQESIVVTLYDTNNNPVATTTTLADGTYRFSSHDVPSLLPGVDFVVGIELPPALQPTVADNVPGNDATDSDGRIDPNGVVNVFAPVTAPMVGVDLDTDFGLVQRFALGNRVWLDLNGDGVQDNGESDLAGVVVSLLEGGSVIATTSTNSQGLYQFDSLLPGKALPQLTTNYAIEVSTSDPVLAAFKVTQVNEPSGGVENDNDGAENANRQVSSIANVRTPAYGIVDNQFDFGFRSIEIGNRVWRDNDADGEQDAGEPGIAGVRVDLLDSNGQVVATTETDADGEYAFTAADGVEEGETYTIRIFNTEPELDNLVLSAEGTVGDALDSDAETVGTESRVTLVAGDWGSVDHDVGDFGFQPLLEIGNFVWLDSNGNGVQDGNEAGIGQVEVRLSGQNGVEMTVLTDNDGFYLFRRRDNALLLPNTVHQITVDLAQTPLDGLQPTQTGAGDGTSDSDGVWSAPSPVALEANALTPALEQRDLTYDFGFVPSLSVGGDIWIDEDGNGNSENTEDPIVGLVVQLIDGSGNVVGTTTTDANGRYLFESTKTDLPLLPNTDYTVRVDDAGANAGKLTNEFGELLPTLQDVGGDDDDDSDAALDEASNDAVIAVVSTGGFGSQLTEYDIGYVGPLVIGDFVWIDSNADGLQQSGSEPGVGGVTLELYNPTSMVSLGVTTTNATGFYEFNSRNFAMQPNTGYIVRLERSVGSNPTALAGLQVTREDVGGNDNIDSDAFASTTAPTPAFDVVATTGERNSAILSYDIGLVEALFVNGTLWLDRDVDGTQNELAGNELAGITVELRTPAGALIASTTTASDGTYAFSSVDFPDTLLPGETYHVEVPRLQSGLDTLHETQADSGSDASDSDGTRVSDAVTRKVIQTGAYGAPPQDSDFGFVQEVVIGDFVWHDVNSDGVQEAGEPGLPNIEVQLLNAAGVVVATTDTNAQGLYRFDSKSTPELVAGDTYAVKVPGVQPDLRYQQFGSSKPYTPTEQLQGGDRGLDSNGVPSAIAGVSVEQDSITASFAAPAHFQEDLTIDFGFVQVPFTEILIGDFVWVDENANGLQDNGERAIPNVVIRLLDANGAQVGTTTTDANGLYSFDGVANAQFNPITDYRLEIDAAQAALSGVVPTAAGAAAPTNGTDSNGVHDMQSNLVTYDFRSQVEGADQSFDFGFTEARVGDYVWHDLDNNGIQNDNEPAIAGVVVQLFSSGGAFLANTTTDADGLWSFTSLDHGLVPGATFEIRMPIVGPLEPFEPTQQNVMTAIDSVDSDVQIDAATRSYATMFFQAPAYGTQDLSLDAGFVERFSLGDTLFIDENGDGEQDTNEPGVGAGVVVVLRPIGQPNVELARTVTDADGKYEFESLRDDMTPLTNYLITIDANQPPLDDLRATGQFQTMDGETDSNIETVGPLTAPTRYEMQAQSPAFGAQDLSFDAGFVRSFAIGDFVWLDADADGLHDAAQAQAPIEGVTVTLYSDANRTTEIGQTTTDASGLYEFRSLDFPAMTVDTTYTITVSLPDGLQPTSRGVGADGSLDSGAVLDATTKAFGQDDAVATGGYGSTVTTYDYGFVEVLSIGDRVWLDANGNGVQDAGEAGIEGVTVVLIDSTGNAQVTTTDAQGLYEFNSREHGLLPSETYTLSVSDTQAPLAELQGSPAAQGGDAANDSNGVLNVAVQALEYEHVIGAFGSDDKTLDFGFRPTLAIGDVLFIDGDGDGQQGDAQPPVSPFAGVELTLLDANNGNAVIGVTQVQPDGSYLFDSLVFTDMQPNTPYVIEIAEDAAFDAYRESPLMTGANTMSDSHTAQNASNSAADTYSLINVETPFYGTKDLTFDAGFVPEITIGDLLFHDLNGDGLPDAGEPPFANVTVQLRDESGNVLQTTTTDADGNYLFDEDLVSFTNYTVTVPLGELPGFQPTPESIASVDSTIDGSGEPLVVIPTTTAEYGSSDLTVDFPFVAQFNIGDLVWFDSTNDGVFTPGETPVVGAEVQLLRNGVVVANTSTDADGLYNFNSLTHAIERLAPYSVQVVLNSTATLDGFQPTPADVGNDDTVDSDGAIDNSLQYSAVDFVAPDYGADNQTYDFGFVEQFEIGDYVWLDLNGDGIQDAGEEPLPNVEIQIVDALGSVVATVATNDDGLYLFNSLTHDLDRLTDYTLRIDTQQDALDAKKPTINAPNATVANDSNGVPDASGRFVLAPISTPNFGERTMTFDFGFVNDLEIGDYVWFDANGDGVQDANELPLEGIEVQLRTRTTQQLLGSAITNSSGQYVFTSANHSLVPFTDYEVTIDLSQPLLADLQPTDALAGGDTALDSNADVTSGAATALTIATTPDFGDADYTFDFGFRERIYIGDFVFLDANLDGSQNMGDVPLGNITVTLLDAQGQQIGETTTDASGIYRFDSLSFPILPNSTYTVSIPQLQAQLQDTLQPTVTGTSTGPADLSDSDGAFVQAAQAAQAVVTTGDWGSSSIEQADFGYVPQFNVGDFVFLDDGADGAQLDGVDTPIEGVLVELRTPGTNDALVATTVTDANGLWSFNSLRNGLVPLTNYRVSIPLDNNAAVADLQPTDADAAAAGDALDSDGSYDAANSRVTWTFSSPQFGSDDYTLDQGFVERFHIGDYLWRDLNGDGVQDAGEPPIAGVAVELYDAASGAPVASVTTGSDGLYDFDSLVHGLEPSSEYVVVVRRNQVPLDGLQQTAAGAGGDAELDSNGVWLSSEPGVATVLAALGDDAGDVLTTLVPPTAFGSDNLSLDFGFVERLVIGDVVFKDVNRDGVQNAGDATLGNVTVALLDSAGALLATTLTDASGEYSFDSRDVQGLRANETYELTVEWRQTPLEVTSGFWIGETFIATGANVGADDALDSDGVATQVGAAMANVSVIELTTPDWGAEDMTFDFGFQDPPLVGAELGNFLWIDSNGDGIQTPGELPLAGVTVQLFNPDDQAQPIAETLTNADGLYRFNTLEDGFEAGEPYIVAVPLEQEALAGFELTRQTQGNDTELDSNARVNLQEVRADAAIVAPIDGFEDFSFDFGFERLELGDFVWFDANHNGVQDAGEPALEGVQVTLESLGGAELATVTTDANGYYLFTSNEHNVQPNADYVIVIERGQPAIVGMEATLTTATAGETTLDSNGVQDATRVSASARTQDYGSFDYDYDFGFYRLLEIGDYVWFDSNANGVQEAGEPPIDGAVVELIRSSDGVVLATTTTDSTGLYQFDAVENGLAPNTTYVVSVVLEPTQTVTRPNAAGVDDALDSDGALVLDARDNSTYLAQTTVTTGDWSSIDTSIDFGVVGLLSIGDRVWLDVNGDGVQDAADDGSLAGVELVLFDADDNEIGRTVSGAGSSNYVFTNRDFPLMLPETEYTIAVGEPPAELDLRLTADNSGADDALDSDARRTGGSSQIAARTGLFGSDDPTFDVGFTERSSIGDFVWQDVNADGVQDAGEPGLEGVVVTLLDANNTVVASTTTGPNGEWRFDVPNVNEPYTVALLPQPILDPLQPSPTNAPLAANDGVDSDGVNEPTSGAILYEFVSGPPGTHATDIDFGLVESFGIGNFVWLDSNFDGVQNDGELSGLGGVTLQLFADSTSTVPLATTVSAPDGEYLFSSADFAVLEPSTDYVVRAVRPDGTVLTLRNAAAAGDELDSDARLLDNDDALAEFAVRTPPLGEFDLTYDVGFVGEARVGDFVWDDKDGDGVQDEGEPGLPGLTLELLDADGNVLATTVTDGEGMYEFTTADGMRVGATYTVRVPYPDLMSPTNGERNDPERYTELTFLAPPYGDEDLTIDFGFARAFALGDFVWIDQDGNGLQSSAEEGVEGIVLTLQDQFGTPVATTTTDSLGRYKFASDEFPMLPSTPYFVSIALADTVGTPLEGLLPTEPESGTTRVVDSNGVLFADLQTVVADVTSPAAGGIDSTIDFGFLPRASLGDRVWLDEDGDGVQDADERDGVEGVVLVLRKDGAVVAQTTTDASGAYEFTDLEPGTYTVTVDEGTLGALSPTTPTDLSRALDRERDETADFGVRKRCGGVTGELSLENRFGLRGVELVLLNAATGAQVDTTTTDNNGQFRFGLQVELDESTEYLVRIPASQQVLIGTAAPAEWRDATTGQLQRSVRTKACAEGDELLPLAVFTENLPLRIGDRVFEDRNGDGAQDANDRSLSGVQVRLYNANTRQLVASTTTDSNGNWEFGDDVLERLTRYTVLLDLEQAVLKSSSLFPTLSNEPGVGDAVDSDGEPRDFVDASANGATVRAVAVDVTTGDFGFEDLTIDFGLYNCVDTDVSSGLPDARIRFTGDAQRDFETTARNGAWIFFLDGEFGPDVGVPPLYPAGTLSGWDYRGIYMAFSPSADELYIAYDCFGVCGDADGDGNPALIAQSFAKDTPDMSGTETFTLLMDTNNDGGYDIVVGVPSDGACDSIQCIGAFLYDSAKEALAPGYRYSDQDLSAAHPTRLHCNPSRSCPDLEFSIGNWSKIPGLRTEPYQWRFGFEAFAGSFVDGGIGEDYMGNVNRIEARFICPSEVNPVHNPFPVPTETPAAPERGQCCEVGVRGGCANSLIERCVCSKLPFCCGTVWSQQCVDAVDTLQCAIGTLSRFSCLPPAPPTAPPTPVPTPSGNNNNNGERCCSAQPGAGCGNAAIEQCVCEADSFCCSNRWDANCASLVTSRRCSTACGAFAPTAAPSAPPVPAPTPLSTDCTSCLTGTGFGQPGSPQWCRCCSLDCGGFQQDCIVQNQFCSSNFRCANAAVPYCDGVTGVVTRPPTPAPSPAAFTCAQCSMDSASQVGSPLYCQCCANNCGGRKAQCESRDGFCSSAATCAGTASCPAQPTAAPTTVTAPPTNAVPTSAPPTVAVVPTNAPPTVAAPPTDVAPPTADRGITIASDVEKPVGTCDRGEMGCLCDDRREGDLCASQTLSCQENRCVEDVRCARNSDCAGESMVCRESDNRCVVNLGDADRCTTDFDADADGLFDCFDTLTTIDEEQGGGRREIRVFTDDGGELVSVIELPSVRASGLRVIRAEPGADETEPIEIEEVSGSFSDGEVVTICLRARDEESVPDARCLQYRESRTDEWSNEDCTLESVRELGVTLLCGDTTHFTQFRISYSDTQSLVDTDGPLGLKVWHWILIGVLACLCCCFVVLALCCFLQRGGGGADRRAEFHSARESELGDFRGDMAHLRRDSSSSSEDLAPVPIRRARSSGRRKSSSMSSSGRRLRTSGQRRAPAQSAIDMNRSGSIIDDAIYANIMQNRAESRGLLNTSASEGYAAEYGTTYMRREPRSRSRYDDEDENSMIDEDMYATMRRSRSSGRRKNSSGRRRRSKDDGDRRPSLIDEDVYRTLREK